MDVVEANCTWVIVPVYFIVAETYRLLYVFLGVTFFVGHAGNKTDEVWRQISRRGVVRMGQILQLARGLVYPTTQTSDLWPKGSPWGAKMLKGVTKFL